MEEYVYVIEWGDGGFSAHKTLAGAREHIWRHYKENYAEDGPAIQRESFEFLNENNCLDGIAWIHEVEVVD